MNVIWDVNITFLITINPIKGIDYPRSVQNIIGEGKTVSVYIVDGNAVHPIFVDVNIGDFGISGQVLGIDISNILKIIKVGTKENVFPPSTFKSFLV